MATIEILLPAMGEGVHEAQITKWLKSEGDTVEEDESLVEIATDKVDSEVPSAKNGVLKVIKAQEGDVVKIGDVLGVLEVEGEGKNVSAQDKPIDAEPLQTAKQQEQVAVSKEQQVVPQDEYPRQTPAGKFLSPLVRNIASQENIAPETLDALQGTGLNERIVKDDLLQYIENQKRTQENATKPYKTTVQEPQPATQQPVVEYGDNYEIVEMDRMRRIIAKHMVDSKRISPHVTSFVEVDMTNIVQWRNRNKTAFQEKYSEKLTFTSFFVEATAKALNDFPQVNASVDGDKIILKKDINIGMATALPSGNLIVPVIKKAGTLNLFGIARQVNNLAARARASKLKPDEIQGGTFTITNFGTFENLSGTPIINQPQVAILGVGTIQKKPAVIETPHGDTIGIRHLMILSLSYDHRIVDGALGGMFIRQIARYLENFDEKMKI